MTIRKQYENRTRYDPSPIEVGYSLGGEVYLKTDLGKFILDFDACAEIAKLHAEAKAALLPKIA